MGTPDGRRVYRNRAVLRCGMTWRTLVLISVNYCQLRSHCLPMHISDAGVRGTPADRSKAEADRDTRYGGGAPAAGVGGRGE